MNKRGLLISLLILIVISGCKEVNKSPPNELTTTQTIENQLGRIYITTDPQAADIFLDDKLIGISPITIDNIPIGPHTIKATKEKYQENLIDIQVYDKQTTTVNLILSVITQEATTKEETSSDETTYTCSDSDLGIDFEIKGITRVRQTICTYKNAIASCSSGYLETKRDDCNTTKTLYEYYCLSSTSNKVSQKSYDCPYGCEYGRCKPEKTTGTNISGYSILNNFNITNLLLSILIVLLLTTLLMIIKDKTKKLRKK